MLFPPHEVISLRKNTGKAACLFLDTCGIYPYAQPRVVHTVPLSLLSSPCQSPGLLFLAAASLLCYSAPSDSLNLSCLPIGLCFAISCLPLFFLLISPISLSPWCGFFSCHSASISSLCLCQYLFLSLPHSHLDILPPSRSLSAMLLFCLPSCSFRGPVITSGHNQERLCLCLCSPPHLLRLH